MAKDETPKCPPQSELPPARVIWTGTHDILNAIKPCRVVLVYTWVLPKDQQWISQSSYVYERAETVDALGIYKYETRNINEVPPKFFADLVEMSDKLNQLVHDNANLVAEVARLKLSAVEDATGDDPASES